MSDIWPLFHPSILQLTIFLFLFIFPLFNNLKSFLHLFEGTLFHTHWHAHVALVWCDTMSIVYSQAWHIHTTDNYIHADNHSHVFSHWCDQESWWNPSRHTHTRYSSTYRYDVAFNNWRSCFLVVEGWYAGMHQVLVLVYQNQLSVPHSKMDFYLVYNNFKLFS